MLSMVVLHTPQYGIVAMNIEEDQDDTRYGKRTSHRGYYYNGLTRLR